MKIFTVIDLLFPENHFLLNTAELQWLEHLRDHETLFETGVARANEC